MLTTSNHDTDVPKLFARIREVLDRDEKFEGLKLNYESAQRMHDEMDAAIHSDTREEIREYLEDAGFEIVEFVDRAYVDAVVIVKARRSMAS